MRRGSIVVLVLLAVGLAMGGFAAWYRVSHRQVLNAAVATRAVPGDHDSIVVEVLNASGAVGLGRTATERLRDGGIDVVYFGSDSSQTLDSTQVLVRRGDAASGSRVARVLGVGAVRVAPDPARLVDVTVRLGRDFHEAGVARNP